MPQNDARTKNGGNTTSSLRDIEYLARDIHKSIISPSYKIPDGLDIYSRLENLVNDKINYRRPRLSEVTAAAPTFQHLTEREQSSFVDSALTPLASAGREKPDRFYTAGGVQYGYNISNFPDVEVLHTFATDSRYSKHFSQDDRHKLIETTLEYMAFQCDRSGIYGSRNTPQLARTIKALGSHMDDDQKKHFLTLANSNKVIASALYNNGDGVAASSQQQKMSAAPMRSLQEIRGDLAKITLKSSNPNDRLDQLEALGCEVSENASRLQELSRNQSRDRSGDRSRDRSGVGL